MLAYRNIKGNGGSVTPGTDGLTIRAIEKCTPEALVQKVLNITKNYNPRAVRRKEIPKQSDPSKTRPLGIPCIWDRLIQQCILQVLEPICEAKFSENSYGFRPNRDCEQAIAASYRHMQQSHLRYVVEFDIKGFFDNVDHSKLIKQMWALGIRDKRLIYIVNGWLFEGSIKIYEPEVAEEFQYSFSDMLDDLKVGREIEFEYQGKMYGIFNGEGNWFFFADNRDELLCQFEETDTLLKKVKNLSIQGKSLPDIIDKRLHNMEKLSIF